MAGGKKRFFVLLAMVLTRVTPDSKPRGIGQWPFSEVTQNANFFMFIDLCVVSVEQCCLAHFFEWWAFFLCGEILCIRMMSACEHECFELNMKCTQR